MRSLKSTIITLTLMTMLCSTAVAGNIGMRSTGNIGMRSTGNIGMRSAGNIGMRGAGTGVQSTSFAQDRRSADFEAGFSSAFAGLIRMLLENGVLF